MLVHCNFQKIDRRSLSNQKLRWLDVGLAAAESFSIYDFQISGQHIKTLGCI